MASYETYKRICGTSGYNGSANPKRISEYDHQIGQICDDYEQGKISYDEAQKRRKELVLP